MITLAAQLRTRTEEDAAKIRVHDPQRGPVRFRAWYWGDPGISGSDAAHRGGSLGRINLRRGLILVGIGMLALPLIGIRNSWAIGNRSLFHPERDIGSKRRRYRFEGAADAYHIVVEPPVFPQDRSGDLSQRASASVRP